ncbi:hypothetical protein COE51_01290 [Bacillus pseudomycoides]|nr:hypothetical protein COE51_01290 [Bacillus pseudomycoides]
MFYEIEIKVYHGNEWSNTTTTSCIKRNKLIFKNELIQEAKQETDSMIINRLNYFYKDCQFDFIKAYHKYGVTFNGTANIRNRLTGKYQTVYSVDWDKDHWNLHFKQYLADKLNLH